MRAGIERLRAESARTSDRRGALLLIVLIALPWIVTSCFDGDGRRDPLQIPWEMSTGLKLEPEKPKAARVEAAGAGDATRAETDSAVRSGPSIQEIALTCLGSGCHAEMTRSGELHVRVAAGSCPMCHVPVGTVADHVFKLAADGGGVCRTCHPPGEPKTFVHLPFREMKCASCHDPHGRDTRPLLAGGSTARLCGRCHEPVHAAVVHGPYAAGECLACHEPHESEFKSLARAPSADLCLSCHDRPIEAAGGERVVANIGAVLESSRFKHGPIREGRCDGCHRAHAAANPNLLHQDFPPDFYQDYSETHYALCFQCHSSRIVLEERTLTLTGFRDGDRNLHFLHVNQPKGRSCRACHEVHASNRPFHIRESVRFGGWELPVEYQRTETGGTCRSGCHKEASYDNS